MSVDTLLLKFNHGLEYMDRKLQLFSDHSVFDQSQSPVRTKNWIFFGRHFTSWSTVCKMAGVYILEIYKRI